MITINELFKRKKEVISEITMSNGLIEIKALSLGATITSFRLMDKGENIVCSYQDKEHYLNNPYYLGSTVGPLAGRTRNGQFEMDGTVYQLDINDKTNHLHGGMTGLHTVNMDMFYEDDNRFPSLVFTKEVDHSAGGYPSKIKYIVTYKLAGYTLMMNHKAFPQTKSPINMTNHMYFNLGNSETILDHLMSVDAYEVVKLDETYCPSAEKINTVNTAFDFRVPNMIRKVVKKQHPQFELTRLIDHPFILTDKHSITLFEPTNKQSLNIKTTGEAVVIYTANFFDEGFVNERGQKAKNFSAIAIEPSNVPNGVNLDFKAPKFYTNEEPFDLTSHYTLSKTK